MTNEEAMQILTDMGLHEGGMNNWVADNAWWKFAKLVAEKEREVVANWIMDIGFATGHGDSIVDLLDQLEWQIAEKEPVAWMSPSWIDPDTRGWQSDSFESIPIEGWLPIYTTPPQRKPLTDEEISNLWSWSMKREAELTATTQQHAFARAIEAKLKEKNT